MEETETLTQKIEPLLDESTMLEITESRFTQPNKTTMPTFTGEAFETFRQISILGLMTLDFYSWNLAMELALVTESISLDEYNSYFPENLRKTEVNPCRRYAPDPEDCYG